MKRASAILAVFLAAVPGILAAGVSAAGTGGGHPAAQPLPAALDRYYPPVAEQPVYLLKMLSLERSFSGIVADLMEGDIEGARGSFEEFRMRYQEAGDMVPEWKREYTTQEVGELGASLAAGERSRALNAVAAVGGICHRCHLATMVPVQQKFRWGNLSALTVKDPLSDVATGYAQFKTSMAANLAGITVDLKQGQVDNARKQFEAFQARFRALSETCHGCHDKRSRYYVDSDTQDTLEEIGRALLSSGIPETHT